MTVRRLVDVAASLLGATLVATALVIIWVARVSVHTFNLYVSELGATGVPTAHEFQVALVLIVAGGTLIAFAGKDVRSRVRFLAVWTPAVSLWIASGFFLVASQVTCTLGCPLPWGGPLFDWQDFTHIVCAVLAFAAASWGILQTAFAHDHRGLARFSLVAAIAVAVISSIGGILSLAQFETDIGGSAELAATTIAILWVVVYGVTTAVERIRGQRPRVLEARVPSGDISSSNRLASPTST
jgi:hypothetical protein